MATDAQIKSQKGSLRAALYARVSSRNQRDGESQLVILREQCRERGWHVVTEYVDIGVYGTKGKRPQLDRLMSDAGRRLFDVVVVRKLDRFARSVRHLLSAMQEFQALGIEFVSSFEQLDTGTSLIPALEAIVELERSLTVERIKAGVRTARAKGTKLGRPRKIVDAGQIARLRSRGTSWSKIARQMNVGIEVARRALDGSPPRQKHAHRSS